MDNETKNKLITLGEHLKTARQLEQQVDDIYNEVQRQFSELLNKSFGIDLGAGPVNISRREIIESESPDVNLTGFTTKRPFDMKYVLLLTENGQVVRVKV